MALKIFGKNILLREVKEKKTAGGIYNPSGSSELYEVMSFGKDVKIELKTGNKVIINNRVDYTFIEDEGEPMVFVKEEDVLAIKTK